ncbi:MAG: hypothetical protein M8353_08685, partial [ANME-2 cluster archaeon]|nr:hypothetical protein [ANME-2 cluster archaeon]
QLQQLCCPVFLAAREKCRCKSALWEDIRSFFRNFIAPSMEFILRAIGQGLRKQHYQVQLE